MTATSVGSSTLSATASIGTIAIVGGDTLLVDNDDNAPNVQAIYKTALDANGISYLTWDLEGRQGPGAQLHEVLQDRRVVHGQQLPGSDDAVRARPEGLLDNGGRLFVSGQDILDQAAGTTPFVHDYLHITWDGTETQNDKATDSRPRGRRQRCHGGRRRRSARPQRPRRRSVRGSDHAERRAPRRSSRTTAPRTTPCRTAARTRSCSSPSRSRPTGPRRRRPT